jgi:hypothetical protein
MEAILWIVSRDSTEPVDSDQIQPGSQKWLPKNFNIYKYQISCFEDQDFSLHGRKSEIMIKFLALNFFVISALNVGLQVLNL